MNFALRKCRDCLATAKTMQSKVGCYTYVYIASFGMSFGSLIILYLTFICACFQFKSRDFTPHTPQSHDYHCSLLSGPLASEDSTTYGITLRSPLNDITHFHVANSQLPQDVIHVILEGVLPRETTLLINECVRKGYFTISQMNERISFSISVLKK